MDNEEITIYFHEGDSFAFTPFYYDPTTRRGIIGQRKNIPPATVVMTEKFNSDLERFPEGYKPIRVKRSSFEELYEAASQRDNTLVEEIIKEKFNLEEKKE